MWEYHGVKAATLHLVNPTRRISAGDTWAAITGRDAGYAFASHVKLDLEESEDSTRNDRSISTPDLSKWSNF